MSHIAECSVCKKSHRRTPNGPPRETRPLMRHNCAPSNQTQNLPSSRQCMFFLNTSPFYKDKVYIVPLKHTAKTSTRRMNPPLHPTLPQNTDNSPLPIWKDPLKYKQNTLLKQSHGPFCTAPMRPQQNRSTYYQHKNPNVSEKAIKTYFHIISRYLLRFGKTLFHISQ